MPKINPRGNIKMATISFKRFISLSFGSMLLFCVGYWSLQAVKLEAMPISHVDALSEINMTGHALKVSEQPAVAIDNRQGSNIAANHVSMLTALDGELAA